MQCDFLEISMTNYKYLMLNNIYNPARTNGRTFNMILPAGGETEQPIFIRKMRIPRC